jgi:glycosyltransferase involved in cell wall biosynthesis
MHANKSPHAWTLHVMHGWGGGLERWVQDYCRASQTLHPCLILKSLGMGEHPTHHLALIDPATQDLVQEWHLTYPIYGTSIVHLEYQQILQEITERYPIESILISSLIGHSLDLLTVPKQKLIICHDYYPICPVIVAYFHGSCSSCSADRLHHCFQENPLRNWFQEQTATGWEQIRSTYVQLVLEQQIPLVFPSEAAKAQLLQLEPRFQATALHTIAHGISLPKANPSAHPQPEPSPTDQPLKLKIMILGRLSSHKGLGLFTAIYPDVLKFADIWLVGCGADIAELYASTPGLLTISDYTLAELPDLVNTIQPDLGLLLSIWPETFSYTLSELMHLGIPPLVTNVGSFHDRIQAGVTGFLVDPEPGMLVKKIQELAQQPAVLQQVAATLRQRSYKTDLDMVADYQTLLIPLSDHEQFSHSGVEPGSSKIDLLTAEVIRGQIHLQTIQTRLKNTQKELEHTQTKLEITGQKIQAMESSKFWKIRQAWFKLRQLLGLKDA